MYCSICGNKLKDTANFCSKCGLNVSKNMAAEEEIICSYCNLPIKREEQTNKCPRCGIAFHNKCYEENQGCTTPGCIEKIIESNRLDETLIKKSSDNNQSDDLSEPLVNPQLSDNPPETSPKEKRRSKFVWILAISITLLIIGLVYFLQAYKNTDLLQQNNNIANSGYYIAQQDDWIYYSNESDEGKLYKIQIDGYHPTCLSDDAPKYINIVGDWVYYSSGQFSEDSVYKIRTDGTQCTRLAKGGEINYINVIDDWIYFPSGSIYKIRTDGSQLTRLNNDITNDVIMSDDWIYYSNKQDGGKIYKIRIDGTKRTIINNDDSSNLNISDNWIYYVNNSDQFKIYKIRTNGSKRTRLNNDRSNYTDLSGDWVYYTNQSDDEKLYKIRTDGSQRTRLNDDLSHYINVSGDWVYYKNNSDDGNGNFFRIRTDGSQRGILDVSASVPLDKKQLAKEILFQWQPSWKEKLQTAQQANSDPKTAVFSIDSQWKLKENAFLFHVYYNPPANQSGFTQTVGWYQVNLNTGEIYDTNLNKVIYQQVKSSTNTAPVEDEKLALLNAAAKYHMSQFGFMPILEPPYGNPKTNDQVVCIMGEINSNGSYIIFGKWQSSDDGDYWMFKKNNSGEWVYDKTIKGGPPE